MLLPRRWRVSPVPSQRKQVRKDDCVWHVIAELNCQTWDVANSRRLIDEPVSHRSALRDCGVGVSSSLSSQHLLVLDGALAVHPGSRPSGVRPE